jgi:hypothetical protein
MKTIDKKDETDIMKNKKEKTPKTGGIKKYINTLWLVITVLAFFMLIGTAFGHMEEISLKQWAHSLEADYIDDGTNVYAEYYDEDNVLHTYNLNGHSPIHNGDKITLYYASDVDEAVPENSALSWLIYYVVFGAAFGLGIMQLRKITRRAEGL